MSDLENDDLLHVLTSFFPKSAGLLSESLSLSHQVNLVFSLKLDSQNHGPTFTQNTEQDLKGISNKFS